MACGVRAGITVLSSLPEVSFHCPLTAGPGATRGKEAQWPQMAGFHAGFQDTSKACPICDIRLCMGSGRWGAGGISPGVTASYVLQRIGEELGPSASSSAPTHGTAPTGCSRPYVAWHRGPHTLWLVAELCGVGRDLFDSSFFLSADGVHRI